MYAYTKSKPVFFDKYFIIQENKEAKSFFKKEVNVVEEKDIENISCSNDEIIILFEKPSQMISDYIQKKGGEEMVLNQGTDIEFHAVKIENTTESCNVGG
jgi:hypothetical protein